MIHTATVLNLAALLEQHVRRRPRAEAVVCGDIRLTFAQLDGMANRVAGALTAIGIGPGDHVALMCPNVPHFPAAYFGILKAGAAVVPLNVLLRPREIAYHLRDSDAGALLCFEGTAELPLAQVARAGVDVVPTCRHLIVMMQDAAAPSPIEDARTLSELTSRQADTFETYPTAPDDTAVILYTSGTTGQPKGAELTHFNMAMNAIIMSELRRAVADAGGRNVTAVTLPLFHSTAQTSQMNAYLHMGGTLVLLPHFDPAALIAAIVRERVTHWVGVPTMYWSLLEYVRGNNVDMSGVASTLRVAVSGGAPMPAELMADFERTLGVRVVEGYGLSETSPVAATDHLERPSRPGTVGQAILGVEIRCVDSEDRPIPAGQPGEIVIRGPNVMKGYYKRAEATGEAMRNGWFHTGDIGTIDADGYVRIVDRKKDMILRGGFSVYPREIEDVLVSHPGISQAAVVGVPDPRLGEDIKAFVVRKPGAALSEDDVRAWCKERLAVFKCPRLIEFRASLPTSATGKILKRELREEQVSRSR
jgi:long-chain acyl-CoA synthetase